MSKKLAVLLATALLLAMILANAGMASAVADTQKYDRTAQWKVLVKSDLRNVATAAVAYASDQPDGSYTGMTLAVLQADYGFVPTQGVTTQISVVDGGDGFLARSEHSRRGSAFQYDSATGEITPIPRF